MTLIQTLYENGTIQESKKNELEAELKVTQKTEEEILLKSRVIDEASLFALKSKLIDRKSVV